MKIVSYSSAIVGNPWKNWLFLRLETDTGTEGFGEVSLNGFARTVEAAMSELQGYFVGRSPFRVISITRDMLMQVYSDGGQIHRGAIAAVEAACWDIVGKSVKEPLWNLWGGPVRESIRLYANGWYRSGREPAAFASDARDAMRLGYTALKFDPFGKLKGIPDSHELRSSLEIVRAVRDEVGSDIDLMIEGHCRFDVATALIIADKLADMGILWFEEPVSHRNLRGLIEVAQRSPVRIATGENFTSFREFVELCNGSQNFVLQPDIMNLGGLRWARQVCELGESLEVPLAPHDAQGPISKASCLQLAAISPAVFIQEDFEEFNAEWTREIASPVVKREGAAIIPREPGLGRSLFWDRLADFPYDRNATLTLYTPGWERRSGKAIQRT